MLQVEPLMKNPSHIIYKHSVFDEILTTNREYILFKVLLYIHGTGSFKFFVLLIFSYNEVE